MNHEQTLLEKIKQDLRTLRLKDMAEALDEALKQAENEPRGHLQFFAGLVEKQLQAQKCRSLQRRIRNANFPRNMTFESYDWTFQPGLNVEYVKDLAELGFIVNHQPLLILGKTGAGKTHLATAFGIRACQTGFRVQFYKLQLLLIKLYATLADDTTYELIDKLSRLDLIIIDNLSHLRSKPEYPTLLLDLISACQDRTSIIVSSSSSFEELGTTLGNHSITKAIIDRLFHKASVINIRPGRSYRTEGPHAPKLSPNQEPPSKS